MWKYIYFCILTFYYPAVLLAHTLLLKDFLDYVRFCKYTIMLSVSKERFMLPFPVIVHFIFPYCTSSVPENVPGNIRTSGDSGSPGFVPKLRRKVSIVHHKI